MLTQENISSREVEQIPTFEGATVVQRLFAFLLDGLIVTCLFFLIALVTWLLVGNKVRWNILGTLLFVGVELSYHVFFWTRPHGQTVGKRFANNRVIKIDGSRLTLGDALLRWIARYLNTLVLGLGWLTLIVDAQHRGWHDRAARTQVVLSEPSATADSAPFRPRSVAWSWLLLGIPGTTLMAGVNWQRMGHPERFRRTVLGGLVLTLGLLLFLHHPLFSPNLLGQSGVIRRLTIALGVSVVYSITLSRAQKEAYHSWYQHHGSRHPTPHQAGTKTLGRIILFSIGINLLFNSLVVPALVRVTASWLPDRQFTDQTITLTYPGAWWTTTDFAPAGYCEEPGITCLMVGSSQAGNLTGLMFELDRISVRGRSAESADSLEWEQLSQRTSEALLIRRRAYEISSHSAVERRFTLGTYTVVLLYLEAETVLYRFYARAPTEFYRANSALMEQLIQSVQLKDAE